MRRITRIMSMILAVLMLALLAVSCADNNAENPTETTAAADATGNVGETSAEETENQYDIKSNLPAGLNFNNSEIRIISRENDGVKDEISVTDYTGETINDAVYERNAKIEEDLGVKIVNNKIAGDNYVVVNEVKKLVTSGVDEYDLLANSVYSTIMETGENIFRNLTDIEYLDLDQVYWSQGFNKSASYGDKQYFCTGSIALTLYRYMFVTMFNKTTFESRGITNLYETVNKGEWTLDYQFELANQMYEDFNGDSAKDQSDRYGFISGSVAYVDPYWSACKLPILNKTADNKYEYAVDVDRMTSAIDKIIKLYHNCEGSYIYASVSDAQDQANLAGHFGDGRAATATLRLLSVETGYLRDMTDPYGIIPVPKLDAAQDGYQTFVHDQFTALAIPSSVKEDRLDMIGAFLEAMACESYRMVIPAYYEIALKGKYLSDAESAVMLDMIYESIYIDSGVLFTKTLSSVHQQIRTIVKSKTNSTAATFKGLSRVVPKQLDGLMEKLDRLG